MSVTPSTGRKRGSRGARLPAWWHGALVVAPLLVLTVLGWRGLQVSRSGALEAARAQSLRGAEKLAVRWKETVATLPTKWPLPRLYPDPPNPAAANGAQELFRQAGAADEAEVDSLLDRLAAEHPDALAESGIPLLPLVLNQRLRRARDLGESTALGEQLARVAVETHPSILTSQILESADRLLAERGATPLLEPWKERWVRDELARSALKIEAVRVVGSVATMSPWVVDEKGGAWWRGAATALVAKSHLDSIVRDLGQGERVGFPTFLAASVVLDGVELGVPSKAGEELARAAEGALLITVRLTDAAGLYAEQRAQSLWLAALLATALASVLAGFWLSRRSLARERQLGELKSNFVASVSHELRAPVASMRVMAENLETGVVHDEPRRAEYHRLISEECRRLSGLIDNVLDFARIEQNRKTYRFEETDVAALVKDAVALAQARASQRRQAITVELEPVDPPPVCDGAAIQQALINLLDNALKFSPPGSQVVVRLRQGAAACWELSVEDSGPGIPPAEQHRIFERFYRIGSELCRETQGAGIGLSIVQHIAEGHDGRVEVASELGKGAKFTLALPCVPASSNGAKAN